MEFIIETLAEWIAALFASRPLATIDKRMQNKRASNIIKVIIVIACFTLGVLLVIGLALGVATAIKIIVN